RRPPHAHDAAGAAVVAVQHPVDFEPQLLGHVRRIIRARLRRDRESAQILLVQPGLPQRVTNRLGVVPKRRSLGLSRVLRRAVTGKAHFFSSHDRSSLNPKTGAADAVSTVPRSPRQPAINQILESSTRWRGPALLGGRITAA